MTALAAALLSWQLRPGLCAACALCAACYARGWRTLRTQMPDRFGTWRLAAFLAGLVTVVIAAASPLDTFASVLLPVHMLQHLLLTMAAPPLIWLGAPALPLLRGLPPGVVKSALGPFLASSAIRRVAAAVAHPAAAWLTFTGTIVVWHFPALYQLALRAPGWHELEHAAFLTAGLLFWWPVVQPWPSVPVWPRWAMLPYLLLADAVNSALSAWFVFSERVVYPAYAAAPRLSAASPLDDQVLAGALMWVPGSLVFLVPVAVIVVDALNGTGSRTATAQTPAADPRLRVSAAAGAQGRRSGSDRIDLLRAPLLGAFLRWRHGRRTIQLVTLGIAVAVVLDGLIGPQMAPMNLAGVLPWTYARALLVIALMTVGNVFCMACPFTLPRELAKRYLAPRRRWPHVLRGKWIGAALLVVYLCSYEAWAPWDSPRATAVLLIAYWIASFAVDGLFRGAAFCKYLCPIGQFQFVQSLASPFTIAPRAVAICGTCAGRDCIRGNARRRGCELDLSVPQKQGNLDCTYCLDCVAACPHDNIGLLATRPLSGVTQAATAIARQRTAPRLDVGALALVTAFAAVASAAVMVAPVADRLHTAAGALAMPAAAATLAFMLLATTALPATAAAIAARVGTRRTAGRVPPAATIARYSLALIPFGLSMWGAHFLFHLWTAGGALPPVIERVAAAVGIPSLSAPSWPTIAPAAGPGSLTATELVLLDAGLLCSLYAMWSVGVTDHGRTRLALRAVFPWCVLAIALWVAGAWALLQPMDMRGMVHSIGAPTS
jgi:cytochrome c oxidase assembly factor CtaG/polyferredoxin